MSAQIPGGRPPIFSNVRRNGESVLRVADWEPGDPELAPDDPRWLDVAPEIASRRQPSGWTADEILADVKRLRAEWTDPDECGGHMPAAEIDRLVAMLLERDISKPTSAEMEHDPVKWMAGMLGGDSSKFKREQFNAFHDLLSEIKAAVLRAMEEQAAEPGPASAAPAPESAAAPSPAEDLVKTTPELTTEETIEAQAAEDRHRWPRDWDECELQSDVPPHTLEPKSSASFDGNLDLARWLYWRRRVGGLRKWRWTEDVTVVAKQKFNLEKGGSPKVLKKLAGKYGDWIGLSMDKLDRGARRRES